MLLVATEDISANTELFKVGSSCILATRTSDLFSNFPISLFSDYLHKPWQNLILVLIYERFQGKESRWEPYIQLLPKEDNFDTLMYWTNDELAELQASAIVDKIGKNEAEQMFAQDILPVIEQYKDVFHGRNFPEFRWTKEEIMTLCHNSASIIMAYAFDLENDKSDETADEDGYVTDEDEVTMPKGLVPMADLLNADADFNARLFKEENGMSMRAIRDIKKGEEILNDFGQHPRAELLRRYGYVTDKYAKFDVVEIPSDLVIEVVDDAIPYPKGNILERFTFLLEEDITPDGFIIDRADDEDDEGEKAAGNESSLPPTRLPTDLLETISYLLADSSIWKKWQKRLTGSQKHALNAKVHNVVKQICNKRLEQYPTSASEDQKLLKQGDLSKRHRFAVEVRSGEKRLLEEAASLASDISETLTDDNIDAPPSKRTRIV